MADGCDLLLTNLLGCLQLPLLKQQTPARQSLPELLLVLLNKMNCLGFFPPPLPGVLLLDKKLLESGEKQLMMELGFLTDIVITLENVIFPAY